MAWNFKGGSEKKEVLNAWYPKQNAVQRRSMFFSTNDTMLNPKLNKIYPDYKEFDYTGSWGHLFGKGSMIYGTDKNTHEFWGFDLFSGELLKKYRPPKVHASEDTMTKIYMCEKENMITYTVLSYGTDYGFCCKYKMNEDSTFTLLKEFKGNGQDTSKFPYNAIRHYQGISCLIEYNKEWYCLLKGIGGNSEKLFSFYKLNENSEPTQILIDGKNVYEGEEDSDFRYFGQYEKEFIFLESNRDKTNLGNVFSFNGETGLFTKVCNKQYVSETVLQKRYPQINFKNGEALMYSYYGKTFMFNIKNKTFTAMESTGFCIGSGSYQEYELCRSCLVNDNIYVTFTGETTLERIGFMVDKIYL